MSHFTVLVVGPDHDKQLAPYHEYECTGVADRANPNAKWDWYEVGGRWTGFFLLKEGAKGVAGSPGLMTEPAGVGRADQCQWGDVDIDGMCIAAAQKAGKYYDEYHALVRGRNVRDATVAKELQSNRDYFKFMFREPEEFKCSREEFVQRGAEGAIVPFALVHNGRWYERGKMHMFAIVSDEKSHDTWNTEVQRLLRGLEKSTQVTLVDCHI